MEQLSENIFQIWDRLGRKTPFMVKQNHWPTGEFVVIERVECKKLPNGIAFGYPIRKGKLSDHFQDDLGWLQKKIIPLASDSSWVLVIANYNDLGASESDNNISSTG